MFMINNFDHWRGAPSPWAAPEDGLDFKALEALRAIAETGSFRAAARRLRVTQSAVSHQIKKLEAELGETLVVRAKPRVYLSPSGDVTLVTAERVANELAELKRRFAPVDAHELSGVLRVAASTLSIVYLVGDLLERFIAEHPKIELIVTTTETPVEGVRQVVTGHADVAFTPLPLRPSALGVVALGKAEHVIIARPSHAVARHGTVTADELRRYPFVRYQTDAGSRHASDQLFLGRGGYPPIFMESNDTEFIKRIVGLGIGVALVPSFTVRREIAAGRFTMLRVADFDFRQEFCLVHRAAVRLRTVEVFKRFCLERRADIPVLGADAAGGRRKRVPVA